MTDATVSKKEIVQPLPCPFCDAPAQTYNAWGAWGVECTFCEARIRGYSTREGAIKAWNRPRRYNTPDKDDPWHVRCPNCGHIGLLDHEQTVPTEGEYDYWMKCEYCKADVAIPVKGWARRWED